MNKRVILFIFGLLTLRFISFLFGKTVFFGDNYSLIVPGKIFTAQWLQQGILPLWNPYILGGISWIGNINESILYPTTLFFMVFHPAIALNLTIISHLLFTSIGMYLFLKNRNTPSLYSIMGSILWIFSTQVTGSINNLTTLQSITWVPWVIWASHRFGKDKYAILYTAICVTLQILGGYPQYVFYTLMLAGVLSLLDNWKSLQKKAQIVTFIGRWILTGLITLGFTAFVLLPFLDTLQNSTRTIQNQMQADNGAVHPAEFIKILVPYFFDSPQVGMKWGPAWNGSASQIPYIPWVGVVAIILVIFSNRKRSTDWLFGVLLTGSLLFSLGDTFVGFRVFQMILPFFKATRGPNLILPITTVVSILWVIDVLQRFEIKNMYHIKIQKVGIGGITVLISLFFLILFRFESVWMFIDATTKLSASGFHTLERDRVIFQTVGFAIFTHLLFLSVSFWALAHKRIIVLMLILSLEMHIQTSGLLFFAPNTIYPSKTEILEKSQSPFVQTVGNEWVLTSNTNSPYTDFGTYFDALTVRAPFSDSYIDQTELTSFAHLQRMREGMTPGWNMVYGIHTLNGYTSMIPLDVNETWNQGDPAINGLPPISLHDPKLQKWGIQYYLVDTWFPNIPVPDTPIVYEHKTLKLYELPNGARIQFTYPTAKVTAFHETPNSAEIEVASEKPTLLTLTDRYDDNWDLTVNGEKQRIQNISGHRGVELQAGKSNIRMTYAPHMFIKGMYITSITVMGCLIFVGLSKLREKKEN